MEFKSLEDIIRYVDTAFALKFYSGASVLRKGVLKVLARVFGGALYMISLLCKRIWKNRFLTTCEVWALDGFGVEFELPHKAPTYAKGYIEVSFETGYSSATVPAGTYFVDPVTKLEYRSILAASISSSNKRVRVVAVNPGADYNASVGVVLEFRDATPTGLASTAEVVGEGGLYGGYSVVVSIDGVDQVWGETAEEYRARLLDRERNPSRGGCLHDYRQWAERFDFVSKAYPIAHVPVENSVCVVLANYKTEQIYIASDDVAKVSNYINSESRRVATADPRVFSATVANFTVKAKVAPFNSEVQESALSALKEFFFSKNPGSVSYFDDVQDYVRSNSLATTFRIDSVTKGGSSVSSFSLTLDAANSIGEVAKITTDFSNGE